MHRLRFATLWVAFLLCACTGGAGPEAASTEPDAAATGSNGEATPAGGTQEEGGEPSPAGDESEAASRSARDPVLVRVQPVRVDSIENKLEITARVESLNVVDVIPERAEPVLEIMVEEGDVVEAGQVLATLRTTVCKLVRDEATVRLADAKNALEQARRDHERNQSLFKEGGARVISEQAVETSAQAVITADTVHEAAKVALERAEYELEHCTLRAPIAGTVTFRDISVGDFASVGMRAFQIVDLSAPKAIFYRPQRELASLRQGQKLVARSEALPDEEIPGFIERISPTVDPVSGTVKVTAALQPEGHQLPTGVLVDLVLVLERHDDALLVPKRALLYEGRRPYCFVVRDGKALRIDCTPGFEDPDFLEVLPGEDGLRPDDRVVTVGADRLASGDPVTLAAE